MTNPPKNKKPVYAGLSVTHHELELAVFSPKTMGIDQSFTMPLPPGLIDNNQDTIQDPAMLKECLVQLFKQVTPRPTVVHLSLPGTLLRMVEMNKMDPAALYLSLSSEAERYKAFDNTEASVDFVVVPNPALPNNMQQLVLGAIRSDVLGTYLKIFKDMKIKPASVSLEPVNILRGMAATGVLDSLVQQIGTEVSWGMILVESGRVRFSLWRADEILELRELSMDTSEFATAADNFMVVEDLLEEMRRTSKNDAPCVWLTTNMPVAMEQVLSERLGVPVRSAPIGNAIGMNQPLKLSALGAATTSLVPFPFELDIMKGVKSTGAALPAGPDLAGKPEEVDGGSADAFIPAGIAGMVIGGIATGVLYGMSMFSGQGLPDLQSKVDTAKLEVAALQTRESQLRSKANLNQELQNILKQAKARAHAYVALTNELKDKIPTDQVWIQDLKIETRADGNPIEMVGKALNHQSVINFARGFDGVPYTKAVLIDSIKEGKIRESLIYDFKISGSLNLQPILTQIDTENATRKAESGSDATSAEKSGA